MGVLTSRSDRTLGNGAVVRGAWMLAVAAFLSAALGGCRWDSGGGELVSVEVLIPEPPPAWSACGSLDYRICFPAAAASGEGRIESVDLQRSGADAPIDLQIPKRTNLPLLLYPIPSGSGRADLLRPAGAVFPYSLTAEGRLAFRYEEGFLADLLFPVSRQVGLLEAVNVPRLRSEIREKSEGDPWGLDRGAILETLIYATMRSSRIRMLPRYSLSIPAAAGGWFWGDPFRAAVESDGRLSLSEVPAGTHALLRMSGDMSSYLLLEIDERGWSSFETATGAGESGRW